MEVLELVGYKRGRHILPAIVIEESRKLGKKYENRIVLWLIYEQENVDALPKDITAIPESDNLLPDGFTAEMLLEALDHEDFQAYVSNKLGIPLLKGSNSIG